MKITLIFIVLAYFTQKAHSASLGHETPDEHVPLLPKILNLFGGQARQGDMIDPSAINSETNAETEAEVDDESKSDKQPGKGKPPKVKPPSPPSKGKDPPPSKTTTPPPPPPSKPIKPTTPPPPPPTVKPIKPNVFVKPPPPPSPYGPVAPPPGPQHPYHYPYSVVDPASPFAQPQYGHHFSAPPAPLPSPEFYGPPAEFAPAQYDTPENSYRQSHHSKARSQDEHNVQNVQNTQLGAAYAPSLASYVPQKPAYAPSYAPPSYAPPSYSPVQCPQNLLVGCQPSVQSVPCSAYSPLAAPYVPAPVYPSKPVYRYAAEEEEPQQQPQQTFNEQGTMLGSQRPSQSDFMEYDYFATNGNHHGQKQALHSTPKQHAKPQKDVSIKKEVEKESSLGATLNSEPLVEQQTPDLPQIPSSGSQNVQQMPEAQQTPTMTQQQAPFSQQQMRQMEMPQNQALPQQQQTSMMTHPGFRQQVSDSQPLPSNFQQVPQMMQLSGVGQQFVQQAPPLTQQEFVGQPFNQAFNGQEMMVGSRHPEYMRIHFYRDSVDPDGGYYPQHHVKQHKHKHHTKHHKHKQEQFDPEANTDPEPQPDPEPHLKIHHSKKHHEETSKADEKDASIRREETEEGNRESLGATLDTQTTLEQQAPNFAQIPTSSPQNMQQMPQQQIPQQGPMMTHSVFAQQPMPQMAVPQSPAFSPQPSMMTHPIFFGQQVSNFQQSPPNPPQMMRQMSAADSQFTQQQPLQQAPMMRQHSFIRQAQGFNEMNQEMPLSHHVKQHLKHHQNHPEQFESLNVDPNVKFEEKTSTGGIIPKRPREEPEDSIEKNSSAAVDNESSIGQEAPNFPQMPSNAPQMMRQMPAVDPRFAQQPPQQAPMMPQPMSLPQQQMRQMEAPEFQQAPPMMMPVHLTHPSMRQAAERQFPMPPQHIPSTPQRFAMAPFGFGQQMRQMEEDPRMQPMHMNAMGFSQQRSNDQFEQAFPMHQFDQMNQQPNQHHFVSMANPFAEQAQFAAGDNTYYY
ncbi:mediator of RNA polymerase II transcription subunit 12-like [Sitodiplosis mosellana]|uniref:mediator of RNA polymerase II transcription subunit 12-like n=1 Tax=Sitodiplosis mosellana TaxID=263140 RepID=UPI002445292A|nr:mediator of RNA polymerase II transcription subunit 12-like [Sitodiplosis mosellana]